MVPRDGPARRRPKEVHGEADGHSTAGHSADAGGTNVSGDHRQADAGAVRHGPGRGAADATDSRPEDDTDYPGGQLAMAILKFETNVTRQIALAYDDGRPVEGRFADQ